MTTRRALITYTTSHLDPAVFLADTSDQLRTFAELVHSVADPRLRFGEAIRGTWASSGRRAHVRARDVIRVELLPDK